MGKGLRIRLFFEPRDLWVGLYWNGPYFQHIEDGYGLEPPEQRIDFYLCLLPCLPLKFTFWRV